MPGKSLSFSRRRFLQGAATAFALGAVPALKPVLAAPGLHPASFYRARPVAGGDIGVLVLPEADGLTALVRGTADRLAAEGYHALAPTLILSGTPEADLSALRDAVEQLRKLVSQVYIIAFGQSGNLANQAANRISDVGRVVILNHSAAVARYSFERPSRANTLYLPLEQDWLVGVSPDIWARVSRWLSVDATGV